MEDYWLKSKLLDESRDLVPHRFVMAVNDEDIFAPLLGWNWSGSGLH
jgi:hypothetical protein